MNFKTLLFTSVFAFAFIFSLGSCSNDGDDNPSNITPVDTFETVTRYYISGKVTDVTSITNESPVPLPGVTVSSGKYSSVTDNNGIFIMKVDKAGLYKLSFKKSGYFAIDDATVNIENGTESRETILLNQMMIKNGVPIENVGQYDNMGSNLGNVVETGLVGIQFAKDMFDKLLTVTINPYMSGSINNYNEGTYTSNIVMRNVNIVTSEASAVLKKDAKLMFYEANDRGYLSNMQINKWNGSSWAKFADAPYDELNHCYSCTVATGNVLAGNYQLVIPSKILVGDDIEDGVNTNILMTNTTSSPITYYAFSSDTYAGWVENTLPTNITQNQLNSLLYILGGSQGIYKSKFTITQIFSVPIPVNYTLTFNSKSEYRILTYTFTINNSPVILSIKSYVNNDVDYDNEQNKS